MANRSTGGIFGSTTSLQTVTTGDAIPREYHRKVLKKIAQLTKVIHSLQTKNDEHEEITEQLQTKHDANVQQIIANLAALEQKVGEEKDKACQLEIESRAAEAEKIKLIQDQEKYCSEVEKKFAVLREEHALQVKKLKENLTTVQQEMLLQKKESEKMSSNWNEAKQAAVNLVSTHKLAMDEQQKSHARMIRRLEEELETTNKEHHTEIARLGQKHQNELEKLKASLTSQQQSEEEERLKQQATLLANLTKKELGLLQQVSELSQELCQVKDRLALLSQRERELEETIEDTRNTKDELKERLTKKENEAIKLREAMSSIQLELSIAQERHAQQQEDILKLSATVGELEALRLSHEQIRANLQEKVEQLTIEVENLLGEKSKTLTSQQKSTEQLRDQIKQLEKEVDQLKKGRQELRAQYALEIEAAHAQLGEKETSLSQQHLKMLQQMKTQHQNEIQALTSDKEEAIAALKSELNLKHSQELELLQMKLREQESTLYCSLSLKTEELSATKSELSHLKETNEDKKKRLIAATNQIKELKDGLTKKTEELETSKEQCKTNKIEILKLKSLLNDQHSEHEQAVLSLREHVDAVRKNEREEAEKLWKHHLRDKLSTLRSELSEQYSTESKAALHKMAELKEAALNQAEEQWNQQKSQLTKQLTNLKEEMKKLQLSSEETMKLANETAQQQISALEEEVNAEKRRSSNATDQLKQSHQSELKELQKEMSRNQQSLRSSLHQAHQLQLEEAQSANQLAVKLLREELERQRQQENRELMLCHTAEMNALKMELQEQHQANLSDLKDRHSSSLNHWRHEMNQQFKTLKDEVSRSQSRTSTLQTDLKSRENDLLKLNEKITVLKSEGAGLLKQLQLKQQEVIAVKQESATQLRMREQQLMAGHHAELESLTSQHRHQSNLFLENFNKAKELLSAKLIEAEQRLTEAELRYKNRDSRPEDLDRIQELRIAVNNQEKKIDELMTEKRVYQIELMNREKNYNKLFNANPLVGILDPLCSKKKAHASVASSSSRHSSAPSLYSSSAVESLPALPALPTANKPSKVTVLGGYHQLKQTSLPVLASSSKPPRVTFLQDSSKAANSTRSKLSQSLDTFSPPRMVVPEIIYTT